MKKISLGKWACLALLFLIISFLINLYACAFSPKMSLYGCVDPAYFYMTGKAWAHGMLPYVDFTDVKGPVVFLLFRIGYMLTPDSLNGVFAIYVLAGALTTGLIYRMARIADLPAWAAVMTSLGVMAVAYWSNISYSAAQPELLALPALVWMMGLLYDLLKKGAPDARTLNRLAWSLGLGGGYVLLLKYNMCLPFAAAFAVAVLWLMYHHCFGKLFFPFFLRCCAAALIVILPLIITFAWLGNLYAFADAYFLSNFRSYFGHQDAAFYAKGNPLVLLVKNNLNKGCCLPTVLSLIYLLLQTCLQKGQQRVVAMGFFLFGLSVYATAAGTVHPYYFIYCAPLTVFPIMALCASSRILAGRFCGGAAVASALFAVCVLSAHSNVTSPAQIDKIEKCLSSVPNARILYWHALEQGFGFSSGALPACRVWATLNGMDEAFYDDTRLCIKEGKADFIFTQADLPEEDARLLSAAQYRIIPECGISVYGTSGHRVDFLMWSK